MVVTAFQPELTDSDLQIPTKTCHYYNYYYYYFYYYYFL